MYRNGDIILISRKLSFTIKGALQLFIRFFQNLLYVLTFQFRKVCIYHHVASIVEFNGQLCVFEAIDRGYVNSGPAIEYLKNNSINKYLVLRPDFILMEKDYQNCQHDMLGKKYWYWGTLFFQLIKQLTFDYLWLGNSHKKFDKVYCSEACAFALFRGSNGRYFKRW